MESSSFWFTRLVAALEGAVAAGGAEAAVSRGKPLNQWPAHHHFHSLVLPGAAGRHPLVDRQPPLRQQMQVLSPIRSLRLARRDVVTSMGSGARQVYIQAFPVARISGRCQTGAADVEY
jgi:hypothetical protein